MFLSTSAFPAMVFLFLFFHLFMLDKREPISSFICFGWTFLRWRAMTDDYYYWLLLACAPVDILRRLISHEYLLPVFFNFVFLIGQLKAGSLHFEGDCRGFFSNFDESWLGHRHGRGVRTKAKELWQHSLVKKGLVFFFFFFSHSLYSLGMLEITFPIFLLYLCILLEYDLCIHLFYHFSLLSASCFLFVMVKEQQSPRIQSKVSYKAS